MSDNKFSIDDILNEYSNKSQKPVNNGNTTKQNTEKSLKEKKKFEVNIKDDSDFEQSYFNAPGKFDKTKREETKNKQSAYDNLPDFLKDNKNINQTSKNTSNSPKFTFINKTHENVNRIDKENLAFGSTNKINNEDLAFDGADKIDNENLALSDADKIDNDNLAFNDYDKNNMYDVKPIHNKSENTEIIEGLLKMKRKKVLNNTSQLTPVNRKKIKDIKLDITAKIIPKTEVIPKISPDEDDDEAKQEYLAEKRNKKIRDFVVTGIDDNYENDNYNKEIDEQIDADEGTNDYTCVSDEPQISKAISQLKSTLFIRMLCLFATTVFSTYIVIANDLHWSIPSFLSRANNTLAYIFVLIIIGLLAAFCSYSVIIGGLKSIIKMKPDVDTIASISIIASVVSAIPMLSNWDMVQRQKVHIYIPVAILCLLFNTIGKLCIVIRTERNFGFISSDSEKYAIKYIDDEKVADHFTKGAIIDFPNIVTMKQAGFVNDFMANSYSSDITDRYSKYYTPAVVVVSLIAAIIGVIFNNDALSTASYIDVALTTFAGTIAMSSCVAMLVSINYPLNKASKKYLESGSALLGYSAIDEFSDVNSVVVDVNSLFPEGTVDFVNLKQLSNTSIEEGILVAASLACHANSILKSAFYKMLKGNTELLYPVESYIFEDSMGLSGWIQNKRVLLGNRELMVNHSIDGLPSKMKEKEYSKGKSVPLYLSISGQVVMLFLVKVRSSHSVAKWLRQFEETDTKVVLHCVDSIISLNFLSELFDVSPDVFKLLPFRYHAEYDKETSYVEATSTSLICSGKFKSFSMLINGVKRLRSIVTTNMLILMSSAALGTLISIILSFLSSFSELKPGIVIVFNMLWFLTTMTISSIRKY